MRELEWGDVMTVWGPLVPISFIAGPVLYFMWAHHPGMGILATLGTIVIAIVAGPFLFMILSFLALAVTKVTVNEAEHQHESSLEEEVQSHVDDYEAAVSRGNERLAADDYERAQAAFEDAEAVLEDARSTVTAHEFLQEEFSGFQQRIDVAARKQDEAELAGLRATAEAALADAEAAEADGDLDEAAEAFGAAADAFEDAAAFASGPHPGDADDLQERAEEADRRRARTRFVPELDEARSALADAREAIEDGRFDAAERGLDRAEDPIQAARDVVDGTRFERAAFDDLADLGSDLVTLRARLDLARHEARAEEAMEEGDDHEAAGDVDAAHDAYERAEDAYGRAASVAREHGIGDVDSLESALNEARRRRVHDEIDPQLEEAHDALDRAHDHRQADEYDRAVEAFETAADLFAAAADEAEAEGSEEADSVRSDAADARESARRAEADGHADRASAAMEEGAAAFDEGAYGDAAEAFDRAHEQLDAAHRIADEEGFDDRGQLASRRDRAAERRRRSRIHDRVSSADEAMDRGDEAYDEDRFADARDAFDSALGTLEEVLAEFGDVDGDVAAVPVDDTDDVRAMRDRARQWRGYATIASAGERVDDAYDEIEAAPGDAIDAFDDVIAFLDDLSFDDEGLTDQRGELRHRARRGRLSAELEQVHEELRAAEELYDEGELYDAKERYAAAGEALADLQSRADDRGIDLEALDRYAEACDHNEGYVDRELTGIAEDGVLRRVADLEAAGSTDGEAGDGDAGRAGSQAGGGMHTGPFGADDGDSGAVDERLRRELPDHEVLEFLGSGGTAEVHKIRIEETGEVAALKVPTWEGTLNQRVFEQFTDEAETWAKLDDHDNVVDVYDWGTVPYPWIVMEYIPDSLADRHRGLSLAEKGRILAGIADGLEYAHGTGGVVHLDVKPENVLLTEEGVPKVADWGVSRVVLDQADEDQMGLTPAYSAPEQLGGPGSIDRRTDCYQLGVLSYEVLTGRRPFEADSRVDLREQILESTPDDPSAVAPELPAALDDPVLRALAKRPDDRFEAVILYRNALQEALAAETA